MSNDLTQAARAVRKYWRDWPQERRDKVRDLSSFLADAIEKLACTVESAPAAGECPSCGRVMNLTKLGRLRHHNGNRYVDGWRQMCEGVGELPVLGS